MAPEDMDHLLGKMGGEAGYPGLILDQCQQEKCAWLRKKENQERHSVCHEEKAL